MREKMWDFLDEIFRNAENRVPNCCFFLIDVYLNETVVITI
jgi:hypothetical protein